MTVRTIDELGDFLVSTRKPRKRELISLTHAVGPGLDADYVRARRVAVVLAYAHWEGFVKDAARAYVEFVSYKTKPLGALIVNFQALAARSYLQSAATATRKIAPHIAVAHRFTDELNSAYQIDAEAAIDTESNLNSQVFQNICQSIGINYEVYWATIGHFMDDLFRNRCQIAHGALFTPDEKFATDALRFVVDWMDRFSTEIENAAVQKQYLR